MRPLPPVMGGCWTVPRIVVTLFSCFAIHPELSVSFQSTDLPLVDLSILDSLPLPPSGSSDLKHSFPLNWRQNPFSSKDSIPPKYSSSSSLVRENSFPTPAIFLPSQEDPRNFPVYNLFCPHKISLAAFPHMRRITFSSSPRV